MKRTLFTILSAFSLLLCVAVVVLWVRSYRLERTVITWQLDDRVYAVTTSYGGIYWDLLWLPPPPEGHVVPSSGDGSVSASASKWTSVPPPHYLLWTEGWRVPFWFVAVLAAVLPARQCELAYRRRRALLGQRCVECGYNLRATPERCPECGAVPEKAHG